MLKEMGGEDAVPAEDDSIDMLLVMRELTIGSDRKQKMMVFTIDPETGRPVLQEMEEDDGDDEGAGEEEGDVDEEEEELSASRERVKAQKSPAKEKFRTPKKEAKESKDGSSDAKDGSGSPDRLLHSGGVLGDLPGLPGSGGGNAKVLNSNKKASEFHASIEAAIEGNATLANMMENNAGTPVAGKKEKKGKKSKKRPVDASVPPDMPREFLCQLTQKQLSDPVRTPYGNVYERKVILDWFKNQGHLCPMTGKDVTVLYVSLA
jgi:hypothetical protein